MDEPFAALDAQTREFMQMELARIWEHLGIAIVFVTHSLDEALFLADRIVLMGPRPGTVEEVLPIELPRPRWDYDFRASPEFLERRGYLCSASVVWSPTSRVPVFSARRRFGQRESQVA